MTARAEPIRELMSQFTKRSTPIALSLLIVDIVLLGIWMWAAVYSEQTLVKVLFALLAGDRISALFVNWSRCGPWRVHKPQALKPDHWAHRFLAIAAQLPSVADSSQSKASSLPKP